jgi:hypothetical protein
MHRKIKQTQYDNSVGTIYTEACLAQRNKLASVMLHEVVPQARCNGFLLGGKPPATTGLHTMTYAFY